MRLCLYCFGENYSDIKCNSCDDGMICIGCKLCDTCVLKHSYEQLIELIDRFTDYINKIQIITNDTKMIKSFKLKVGDNVMDEMSEDEVNNQRNIHIEMSTRLMYKICMANEEIEKRQISMKNKIDELEKIKHECK